MEEQGSTFQLLGGSTSTVMMALSLLARGQFPVAPADVIFLKVTSRCPRLQYLPGPSTYGPRSQVHGKRTENDRLTVMAIMTQQEVLLGANLHSVKVGWENEVKWRFFCPLLGVASLGVVLMLIVLCNLATPAIRCL